MVKFYLSLQSIQVYIDINFPKNGIEICVIIIGAQPFTEKPSYLLTMQRTRVYGS